VNRLCSTRRVAHPSARHRSLLKAQLKLAWVPNLFCGFCRKGSGLNFALQSFVFHLLRLPRRVLAGSFTRAMSSPQRETSPSTSAMAPYVAPKRE
jgi:hypothetical protein